MSDQVVGYLHGGWRHAAPRHFSLVADDWAWKRVGGSSVLHLVPPQPLRLSRTACYRLSVYEVPLEAPDDLPDDTRRCQGCQAKAWML